jgi:hypothetical protein
MITLSRADLLQKPAAVPKHSLSLLERFMYWADNQNANRIGWMGIALGVHGCFITPLTAMVVMATTYNFALLSATIAAMAFSLVTNLAALPTRITIPVFFLSIAADLIIIIVALTTLL